METTFHITWHFCLTTDREVFVFTVCPRFCSVLQNQIKTDRTATKSNRVTCSGCYTRHSVGLKGTFFPAGVLSLCFLRPSYWSHRESINHWEEREYLREFQGDGLQMNIALDPGTVPRPQRLFGAVSLQKSRRAHRLQDVVMIAALHALVHGLLSVTRTSVITANVFRIKLHVGIWPNLAYYLRTPNQDKTGNLKLSTIFKILSIFLIR